MFGFGRFDFVWSVRLCTTDLIGLVGKVWFGGFGLIGLVNRFALFDLVYLAHRIWLDMIVLVDFLW